MTTLPLNADAWRVVYSINLAQYVVTRNEMRVAPQPCGYDPKAEQRATHLCAALNRVYEVSEHG